MLTKLLDDQNGLKTYALVLETGEDAMDCLARFAAEESIEGAKLSAIGAFRRAVIAYFDWEAKEYRDIPVDEQVEVAALNGDIGRDEAGAPALHAHVVLGRSDGSALAGHLKAGEVRPTLEIVVTETPGHLRRVKDAATGLSLIPG